jgi:hypothetical protein
MKKTIYLVFILVLASCGNGSKHTESGKDSVGASMEKSETNGEPQKDNSEERDDVVKEDVAKEANSDVGAKPLKKEDILGDWILVDFNRTGSSFSLKDCDKKTVWHFTNEEAKPLGDGTEMNKLIAEKGEGCKQWFGFKSSWVIHNGKLFISSSSIGGVGGVSQAGVFDSVQMNGDEMILKAQKSTYTFKKK